MFMTQEEARLALLRALRRLQDVSEERLPPRRVLSSTWRTTNGTSQVIGWGKLQVQHITSQRAFEELLHRDKKVLRTFPNRYAAKVGDLRYPNRVPLDLVTEVELSLA
ncbi:MAG: hypothetical protein Q7S23_01140 [bacterium]|nr:hypothetical protein [bacterium]